MRGVVSRLPSKVSPSVVRGSAPADLVSPPGEIREMTGRRNLSPQRGSVARTSSESPSFDSGSEKEEAERSTRSFSPTFEA